MATAFSSAGRRLSSGGARYVCQIRWKEALREPNAWAWIAVLALVLAIGAGTIIFAGPEVPKAQPAAAAIAAQAK